jgi:hypothetical protein
MFQNKPSASSFDSEDPKLKRRLFTPEEDALLFRVMVENPFLNWMTVASHLHGRTPRQCRDRWANYLSPDNKNGPWTELEDEMLIAKFHELGAHWTTIAKFFEGRSESNVKNR